MYTPSIGKPEFRFLSGTDRDSLQQSQQHPNKSHCSWGGSPTLQERQQQRAHRASVLLHTACPPLAAPRRSRAVQHLGQRRGTRTPGAPRRAEAPAACRARLCPAAIADVGSFLVWKKKKKESFSFSSYNLALNNWLPWQRLQYRLKFPLSLLSRLMRAFIYIR